MDQIDKYLETIYLQEELHALNEFDLKKIVSKLTPESKTKALTKKISTSLDPKG